MGNQQLKDLKEKSNKPTAEYSLGFSDGSTATDFVCFGFGMAFAYAAGLGVPFSVISAAFASAAVFGAAPGIPLCYVLYFCNFKGFP